MKGIHNERQGSMMGKQSLRKDDCLESVIEEYSTMVYRLAVSQTGNRTDADDVFQEVFLRYIRRERSFESEEHRKAWLIRVTVNCCKNYFNSAWMKKTVSQLADCDMYGYFVSGGIMTDGPWQVTFPLGER